MFTTGRITIDDSYDFPSIVHNYGKEVIFVIRKHKIQLFFRGVFPHPWRCVEIFVTTF